MSKNCGLGRCGGILCTVGAGSGAGVGNGTGKPVGIAPATRTRPAEYPNPWGHGFTRQKESKSVENGPELRELGLISMNFTKSAVTPSVLAQKLRSWACFKAYG